ncbi:MAG: MoaD/ThiS family protein [Kofleriaceae bacterium]|nr:MoaD/ThiS family protein [Kofleriaceae bacterium]
MANVALPAALRAHAGNQRLITVAATTVGAALQAVQLAHPALQGFLLDSTGAVPRHIVVFVENSDIRHGQGVATAVTDGTVITVVLPVAGGAGAHLTDSSGTALSTDAIHRYGRQLLLPWMSGQAQRRFQAARVSIELVAGDTAPHWVCLYLAHAGVGHLQLQGDPACCDGPVEQYDILGSPLLRTQDLGAPRAQRLQRQLTLRIPQLNVSIRHGSDDGSSAGLAANGNGSISQAMWHGSHVAAIWLRQTATHPER